MKIMFKFIMQPVQRMLVLLVTVGIGMEFGIIKVFTVFVRNTVN